VRELAFRWATGWPGRLLLGAAYGIVEEGLMAKSFFDPNWPDIGILGSYGRLYGVNWVWSLELTFPRRRDRPWLGIPCLAVVAALAASARLVRLPDRPVSIAPRPAADAPRVPGPRELPFSQFMEPDRSRPDDPRGMRIVDLVMAGLLLAGYLKVRWEGANPPASG
jgi:hypothetical protein